MSLGDHTPVEKFEALLDTETGVNPSVSERTQQIDSKDAACVTTRFGENPVAVPGDCSGVSSRPDELLSHSEVDLPQSSVSVEWIPHAHAQTLQVAGTHGQVISRPEKLFLPVEASNPQSAGNHGQVSSRPDEILLPVEVQTRRSAGTHRQVSSHTKERFLPEAPSHQGAETHLQVSSHSEVLGTGWEEPPLPQSTVEEMVCSEQQSMVGIPGPASQSQSSCQLSQSTVSQQCLSGTTLLYLTFVQDGALLDNFQTELEKLGPAIESGTAIRKAIQLDNVQAAAMLHEHRKRKHSELIFAMTVVDQFAERSVLRTHFSETSGSNFTEHGHFIFGSEGFAQTIRKVYLGDVSRGPRGVFPVPWENYCDVCVSSFVDQFHRAAPFFEVIGYLWAEGLQFPRHRL